jgi:hypothetical protein
VAEDSITIKQSTKQNSIEKQNRKQKQKNNNNEGEREKVSLGTV